MPRWGAAQGACRSLAHAQVRVQTSWAPAQVSCSSGSLQEPGNAQVGVQPRELGEPGAAGERAGALNWTGGG